MVKLANLSLAALAVLAPIAEARNCKKGYNYCGHVLLDIGNYYDQIHDELAASSRPTTSKHINHSLFKCLGGPDGDINYIKYCNW
ncbi:hypothetical protein ACJ41O_014847 [Fusarium nematophilum]